MKIKQLYIAAFISLLVACNDNDCVQDAKCLEQLPSGTTCQAYWESWIYNSATKQCEFKRYSGCSPVGFNSEAECKKCDCID